MPSQNRLRNPWSLLTLSLLLAAALLLWSQGQGEHSGSLEPGVASDGGAPGTDPARADAVPPTSPVPALAPSAGTASEAGEPHLVGVHFEPAAPVTGSILEAIVEIAGEPDHEATFTRHFSWWLNGRLVQESDANQLIVPCRRDDEIIVEASLEDASGARQAVRERVMVSNAGPTIDNIVHRLEGRTYRAQFQATDPEGDDIAYRCHDCPPGMEFDNSILQWNLDGSQGRYPVTVAVRDPLGDASIVSFVVTVSQQEGLHVVVE